MWLGDRVSAGSQADVHFLLFTYYGVFLASTLVPEDLFSTFVNGGNT